MRILVACEESQAVTIELRKLGHEAYSCDLEPCSGGHPEWHIQRDVTSFLQGKSGIRTQDGKVHVIDTRWDMIIAFPPCTYLSAAGARWLYPKGTLDKKRYRYGMKAKNFFMKILEADCDLIAVENPVSCTIFEMPPHTQEIQPWQFGHPYTKKTRLWLKGLPPLVPVDIVEPKLRWAAQGRLDRPGLPPATHRSPKMRSKTFPGIARAMAEQWAGKAEEP